MAELSCQADGLISLMRHEQRALQPPLAGDDLAAVDPVDDAPPVASAEEVKRFFCVPEEELPAG